MQMGHPLLAALAIWTSVTFLFIIFQHQPDGCNTQVHCQHMYTCHMADWNWIYLTMSERKGPCVLPPLVHMLHIFHSLHFHSQCAGHLFSAEFPLYLRHCLSVCSFFCWSGMLASYPLKPVPAPRHVMCATLQKHLQLSSINISVRSSCLVLVFIINILAILGNSYLM